MPVITRQEQLSKSKQLVNETVQSLNAFFLFELAYIIDNNNRVLTNGSFFVIEQSGLGRSNHY